MLKTEMRNPKTIHIDKMITREMVDVIASENYNAVRAVENAAPEIAAAVDLIADAMKNGGKLFYIGAGTSGRLGIMDAAECPPTFGVPYDLVTGIMAGGKECMFRAGENNEDSFEAGAKDVDEYGLKAGDVLVGISAAGGAAYVIGAMEKCKELGGRTVGLSCNEHAKIKEISDCFVWTDTGAEVVTGSTRMNAGTAHKLVLNIFSTCAMIKLGHVYENLMINLKPSNVKLAERQVNIVSEICSVDRETAAKLLEENDYVIRKAITAYKGE